MNSIDRYILRTTLGAFALILVSLTALIWVVTILGAFDIVTDQGQTAVTLFAITSLFIPQLIMIIAPIAFVIAMMYVLSKLNADSEIIILYASGMSPWRVFKPYALAAALVAALVGSISVYVSPKALRELRVQITKVRTHVVLNLLQPGRFTSMDGGALTFHIRERRTNGELLGIFIDDRRDANERFTLLAERGQVQENDNSTVLHLSDGSFQRLQTKERDPSIVLFEHYAYDLTRFSGSNENPTFNVTERYLWDLHNPDVEDPYYKLHSGRFRSELHDRSVMPLYPLAFAVLTFAILGAPRTSRQSRSMSVLTAVTLILVLRGTGLIAIVSSARAPEMLVLLYGSFVVVFAAGLLVIGRGVTIEPPISLMNALTEWQTRRAAARGA